MKFVPSQESYGCSSETSKFRPKTAENPPKCPVEWFQCSRQTGRFLRPRGEHIPPPSPLWLFCDCRCGFHLDGGRVALVALHLRQKFANEQCFVSIGVHISTSNCLACFLGRHISWWLQSTAENHHLALSTTSLSYFWTIWDFHIFFFSSAR